MAAAPDTVHLVYATDRGYIVPTCVSVFSALEATTGPIRVTVLGVELGNAEVAKLRQTVQLFPSVQLDVVRIDLAEFQTIPSHLTATTLARLSIPQLLDGRVIYIDPDTLVCGDLRDLWEIDLQGAPVGGAADLGLGLHLDMLNAPPVLKLGHQTKAARAEVDDFKSRLPGLPADSYVNAGVLLLDNAAIQANAKWAAGLADLEMAARYRHLDQDWLNLTFAKHIHILPARWNVLVGNLPIRRQLRLFRQRDHGARPSILHFAGRRKPWHRFRVSMIGRGYAWMRCWQRVARRWARKTGLTVRGA